MWREQLCGLPYWLKGRNDVNCFTVSNRTHLYSIPSTTPLAFRTMENLIQAICPRHIVVRRSFSGGMSKHTYSREHIFRGGMSGSRRSMVAQLQRRDGRRKSGIDTNSTQCQSCGKSRRWVTSRTWFLFTDGMIVIDSKFASVTIQYTYFRSPLVSWALPSLLTRRPWPLPPFLHVPT